MVTDMILIEEAKFFPWALAAIWPANGITRKMESKGLEITHYPATPLSREKIVIVKDGVKYSRSKVGTKWANIRIIL